MLDISDLKNVHSNDTVEIQSQAAKLVNIYLRQTNKFGIKIQTPQKLQASQLATIIESNLRIPIDKQVIFVTSQQYTHADKRIINLHENTIVHVHNIENCSSAVLRIFVQEIKDSNQISKPLSLQANSTQKIKQFLLTHFETTDMNLFESGRILDLQKTFLESRVCNGSTIYYRYIKQQLNDDQFEKDFNKLFQQEEEPQQSNIKPLPKNNGKRLQSGDNINEARTPEIDIKVAEDISKPNFKKKKIAYEQGSKTPKSSSCIEPNNSSPVSNSDQKIIRALKGKKHSLNQNKNKEEVDMSSSMSLNAKIKLRQEFRKLFQVDITSTENTALPKQNNTKNERGVFEQLNAQAVF